MRSIGDLLLPTGENLDIIRALSDCTPSLLIMAVLFFYNMLIVITIGKLPLNDCTSIYDTQNEARLKPRFI